MGYCKPTALPVNEPVSVSEAKAFLRLPQSFSADDADIGGMIQAAREQGEIISGRALALTTWRLVQDAFPDRFYRYAIDGEVLFQIGMYGLPYGPGGLRANRQVIYVPFPPLVSVQSLSYVENLTGNVLTLTQDVDFVVDRETERARITPLPGKLWPVTMVTSNAVQLDFTAGYDADTHATDTYTVTHTPPDQQLGSTVVTGCPEILRLGIKNLVAYWYNNRGVMDVPQGIFNLFLSKAVYSF
jgi:hypothetical protein